MTAVTIFDAAFTYAEKRRWLCFPCKPAGKAPLTARGLHDASRDPEQLGRWLDQYPDANIGVRTGRESGIVVLDVDGDDGFESLRALERQHGALPRTASVKTPRGGAHYWFAHPGGEVPCSAGRLGVALDVRGDGGYVIAPPSIGPNGNRYEPDEVAPLAMLPAWLRDLMAPPTTARTAAPAETWILIVRDGIPEGTRDADLARLSGHLLARDVDARLVLELALLVNGRCRPPLPDREVEQVVVSIARREGQAAQRRAAPMTAVDTSQRCRNLMPDPIGAAEQLAAMWTLGRRADPRREDLRSRQSRARRRHPQQRRDRALEVRARHDPATEPHGRARGLRRRRAQAQPAAGNALHRPRHRTRRAEETIDDNAVAFEWGVDYLQGADVLDINIDDQLERWAAFERLDAHDPAHWAREAQINLAQAQLILRHTDGTRYVRAGWFHQYVRTVDNSVSHRRTRHAHGPRRMGPPRRQRPHQGHRPRT